MKATFQLNGSIFNSDSALRNIKSRIIEDGKVTDLRVTACKMAIHRILLQRGISLELRACELDNKVRSYLGQYEKV